MPSPMNAQESVTEAMPTSLRHKPQLLQRSFAGNRDGHSPVMAFGAFRPCTDATSKSQGRIFARLSLSIAQSSEG